MLQALGKRGLPIGRARPRIPEIWGDGFADDGIFDIATVGDWESCSPDERIILFPNLVPRSGCLPSVLRAMLEDCVVARARRVASLDTYSPAPEVRSLLSGDDNGTGDCWRGVSEAGLTAQPRRFGFFRIPAHRIALERRLLTFLDGILYELQRGRVPAWDETAEALLAFGAGFHPAYLWPQAALSGVRATVAGWLGHLCRGRSALIPLSVAEYLLDAQGSSGASRDIVAAMAGNEVDGSVLRRAVVRRLAGHDTIVRSTPDLRAFSASLDRYISIRASGVLP